MQKSQFLTREVMRRSAQCLVRDGTVEPKIALVDFVNLSSRQLRVQQTKLNFTRMQ